jgi:hypothetical protein
MYKGILMNRLRALMACTLLGVALAVHGQLHAQQIIRDVVYDDSLLASKNWNLSLWSCGGGPTVDMAATAVQHNGQYSMSIVHSCSGGWGAVVLTRRTPYWDMIWMDPNYYQTLTFWFNPGASTTGDSSLAIFTDNNGPQIYVRDYASAALSPNTWTKVTIPMSALRPGGGQFSTLHFWNMSNNQTQYYIDEMSLDRSVADAQPPVITNLSVAERGYSTITLSLQTDEPAQYNVQYTSGGTTRQKTSTVFSTSHTITLDGLTAGAQVTYSATVTDATGNSYTSGNATTATLDLPIPGLVSPLDGVTVQTPGIPLAWSATAEATSYSVQLSTSSNFSTLVREIPAISTTDFVVEALPNGVYYWRVRAATPHGISGFSTSRSFTKNATQQTSIDVVYGDAISPEWRTGLWDCSGGGIMLNASVTTPRAEGQYSFGVTHSCPGGWGAFGFDRRNADWTVIGYMYPNEYRVLGLSFNPGSDTAAANNLNVMLDNGSDPRPLRDFIPSLQPNQWHTVRIPIADINSSGEPFFRLYFFNMGSGSPVYYLDNIYLEHSPDTEAPVITGLAVDSIAPDGAIIRGNTNERVVYSLVVTGGGDTVHMSSATYARNFRIPLFDRLRPSVTYTYTLTVSDFQYNNSTPNSTTTTGTFTTAEPDTTAPLLVSHTIATVGPTRVALQVATDEPARLTVQYGLTTYSLTATSNTLQTSRLFAVEGLTPETTYQYRLVITDKFGNSRTIEHVPPFTWTTLPIPIVPVTVNTESDNSAISPFIYGTNANKDEAELNTAARRLGGNRLTGYNWENNFSHAGSDYNYQSDDFLPWYLGLPRSLWLEPGIAQTTFHDTSLAQNAYTLLTLQAAGYVAADGAGTVQSSQTAPSSRWKEVRFRKNAPFSLTPDTTDNYVYMDEQVNFLKQQYGGAATETGIKGYSIDNEPDLWLSTHGLIHPDTLTYGELFDKTIRLAQAVKDVDPDAEIFGPASYGFNGFITLQNAPDRNQYRSYGTFLNAYLDTMRRAGATAGQRLLDVLDLHWYPEAYGVNDTGRSIRITDSSSDAGVAYARMQAPRTLWDVSYHEDSWVRRYYGNNNWALLPWLQDSIDTYYPDTKLAITEYSYGAPQHISGGIAQADVLGIFGKYGVYMAHNWYPVEQYTAVAHRIYRNYDGNNSTYGDINVQALWTDRESVSIYAAKNSADTSVLHLILINKHATAPQKAEVAINALRQYTHGDVWAFDRTTPAITERQPVTSISDNSFTYELQPLSVYHIVLHSGETSSSGAQEITTGIVGEQDMATLAIAPNPVQGLARVTVNNTGALPARLLLVDALGREVATLADGLHSGSHTVMLDARALQLPAGVYFCVVEVGGLRRMQPVMITP